MFQLKYIMDVGYNVICSILHIIPSKGRISSVVAKIHVDSYKDFCKNMDSPNSISVFPIFFYENHLEFSTTLLMGTRFLSKF